jgi:hypothetical protein
MFKRHPLIAAIILGLAIGGTIWAILLVGRYFLNNPIDRMTLAELPPEATAYKQIELVEFKEVVNPPAITMPQWVTSERFRIASSFDQQLVTDNESVYDVQAKTRSALDPFRDETLKQMLLDLIDLKSSLEGERVDFVHGLNDEYLKGVGTSLFKFVVFDQMASSTLIASMENPRDYPVRQSEVKSGFYLNLRDEASSVLQTQNELFLKNLLEGMAKLKNEQDTKKQNEIFSIRDYVLEKTKAIEQESNGSKEQVTG